MSADNWTTCHVCSKESMVEYNKNLEKVKNSYGKIPADEYVKEIRKAEQVSAIEETLREDYKIGITDGIFYISYSAGCSVCNFRFNYKKEINVIKDTPTG